MSESPSTPSTSQNARTSTAGGPAMLWLDAAGRIQAVNTAARALWQTGPTELPGEHFASLFAFEVVSQEPDWLDAQWDVLVAAAADRPIPLQAQRREGAPCDVRVRVETAISATPGYIATVELPSPPPTSPLAGAADEKTAGLGLLVEQGGAGFFDLHFKENRVYYSPSWKKLLGYVDAELPNTYDTWQRLIHPDDSAAAPDKLAKKPIPGTRSFSVEFRMKHRLGHDVWIQSIGVQLVDADGILDRVVGIHLDITERKELEEASLANDDRFQALTEAGPLGAFELDFINQRFWYSPVWKQLLGFDEDAANDVETLLAALPPVDAEAGVEAFFLGRATGQTAFIEPVRLRHKDGRSVPFLLGVHRHLTRKRDLARVVGFVCPLPASSAADRTTDSGTLNEPLLEQAFAALAEGVIVCDSRGQILQLNAVASRLLRLSVEKARGQPVAEVFRLVNRLSGRPGDDPVDRALSADDPLPLINEHALASFVEGEPATPIVWTARAALDSAGRPLGVAIVFRDPDEMRLTPEELVKANRFESLGLLAGGISHDFNNLLTTILGGISLATDNRDYSALGASEKACLNAKGLTKQLLMFAKGGTGAQTVVAAREILEDAVKIAAAGSTADITLTVAEDAEPVLVDRAQILQVFQNLVINALQAMPPAPHRARVQLNARTVALADAQVPPLPEGRYVAFEVRDNASGIKPEHLERIFDPFFTTKKHGTGLGLATVLSIVRKHGGQIGVDSTLGVGTAFTVFLPVADKPLEVQARKAASLRFGTGRVLLMDDDPKISALTATMLESLDYKFDLAKDGDEAIVLYKRYLNIGRPYDAVIMDLTVIGGMGGEECFKALRELDPDVRAIVSSGYDSDDMVRQYLDMGFCGYLTKPYRVGELGKVLKAVLG